MPSPQPQEQLFWPDPGVRYYGLSVEVSATDDQLAVTPEATALNQSIKSELKKGSKIAFRPPDMCSNVGADTGAKTSDKLMNS